MSPDPSLALPGLFIAVVLLGYLVIRTRVHVVIALLIASTIAGLSAAMSPQEIIGAITKGFGQTMAGIGLVIGLGVMMGRILEISGAAERIAYSLVKWLGEKREDWALAVTGYIVSIPVFVDSAFVMLHPLAKALAARGGRSVITLGIALAIGATAAHHLIPPTPGPLAAAGIFGVDVGHMVMLGLVLGLPCFLPVIFYARWLGRQHGFETTPGATIDLKAAGESFLREAERKPLPGLAVSIAPIAVPILLIMLKTTTDLFVKQSGAAAALAAHPVVQAIGFFGTPMIALAVALLLAVYLLAPSLPRAEVIERMEEGLASAGIILLVTGAGGALGGVLRDSGTADLVARQIAQLPLPPELLPFFVATFVRFVQGSGTVAIITSASITAPILIAIPGVNLLLAAQAAAMGSMFFSYFNDSMFWVVCRLLGIRDAKRQILVWSVPTTLAWAIALTQLSLLAALF